MRLEWKPTNWRRKSLFVIMGVGVLTMSGPFGTYAELSLVARMLYWTLAMCGVGTFMHAAMWPVVNLDAVGIATKIGLLLVASALASIPGAGIVWLLESYLRGSMIDGLEFGVLWFFVAVTGVAIGLIEYWEAIFAPARYAGRQKAAAEQPPFLARLPIRIGRNLVSLTMQDHYVSAVTTEGSALILMRFADALEEVSGIRGSRIHRSHWIAATALREVERLDGKPYALLVDGRHLPISRPYLRATRALLAPQGEPVPEGQPEGAGA